MNMTALRSGIPVLLVQLLLPGIAAAQDEYNGLVVFGDSLSDAGNKYYITGFANTPPYSELLEFFLVADGPYTRGGLHHSNGATWIEQYAQSLARNIDARPALRGQGKGRNYAYGGARARLEPEIIDNENRHLPTQVSDFLADVNYEAPSDALYMIFIGANDIFDAVFALSIDSSGTTSGIVLQNAIASVAAEVAKLASAGARHIVIINAPDLGLTPAIKLADTLFSSVDPDIDPGEVIATATDLSTAYNAGLNGVLGSVPGVRIIDIFSEIQRLVRHPEEFEDHGIVNSEDACVTPEQPPYVCKQPDGYVFWDGVHPTKVAHGIIADVVAETLAE